MGDFSRDFNNDFNIQTDEELMNEVLKKIQGLTDLQLEWDSYLLAKKLKDILTDILYAKSALIKAATDTSVSGYMVPKLTVDQVIEAYNAVVSGKGAIIINSNDMMHCYVNQADAMNDELSIVILYYETMLITYTTNGDSVDITSTMINTE